MRNYIAQSVQKLKPSGIRRFFDIAATMDNVISLSIGEPDFVTPNHVIEQGIESLHRGKTGYTSNSGILELRQAISQYVQQLYGLYYNPDDQILVTVGVSEGMWLALKAILDPGDEVIVPQPCFVANAAAVEMAGGVAVIVNTRAEDEFQVTGELLEPAITPRTKAILINYPNNPTGAIMTRERLLEVAALAQRHDLIVIADEIYERLVYGVQHTNIATLPGMVERTILMSGMSKSFAMTGWRIGYICAPRPILEAVRKLHQYLIMSAPTIGQYAAIEALQQGEDDVCAMRAEYDQRRRLIVGGFNELGLNCFEPRGAFYAFPNIAASGMNDEEFCERLLYEEQVAFVPGSAFGQSGANHVRACYATSRENIEIALERLARFMQRHG